MTPAELAQMGDDITAGRIATILPDGTARFGRSHSQPLHGDHTRPVPGCLDCEDALQEARELAAQKPWDDQ